jgi:hypothetical protein
MTVDAALVADIIEAELAATARSWGLGETRLLDHELSFFTLGYLIVFGGVIVVIVVLVRLMFWATTALKVITRDREARLDVLLAGDENGTAD